MKEEIEQLLQKFWDKRISLPELQQLYHLLAVYKDQLSADARTNFSEVHEEVAGNLTTLKSDDLLQRIHSELGLEKNGKIKVFNYRSLMKVGMAAAVLSLVLLTSIWLNPKNKRPTNTIVRTDKAQSPPLRTFINKGVINEFLTLEDGSVVELMPKSAITYYQPFVNNRRDISLTGTAFFKVAKDKTRPFTVYANGISTTALGTQFWVFANTPEFTGVKLTEGRVVIKAGETAGVTMGDMYLIPGEQFTFNRLTNKIAVNKSEDAQQKNNPSGNSVMDAHLKALVFSNEPLESVLRKIQRTYKQPLSFNKADVKGLVFTGTFLPTDDLQIVLSALCNMNDLSFENTVDGITIRKYK